MTTKLIQQKLRDLRSRTRRKLLGTVAGPLVAGFFYAYAMRYFAPLRHVLQPLFLLALGWGLAGIYFLNRGKWSAGLPENAGLATGLEFCRREIERQRDFVGRALVWSFGPIMLAMGAFILALAIVVSRDPRLIANGVPFVILVFMWIAAYFVVRVREQRNLQREIDELNDLAAQE